MKHSAPNRWRYGGITDRLERSAGQAQVRMWSGTVEDVRDGDTVLVPYTGAPAVELVGVGRVEVAA